MLVKNQLPYNETVLMISRYLIDEHRTKDYKR